MNDQNKDQKNFNRSMDKSSSDQSRNSQQNQKSTGSERSNIKDAPSTQKSDYNRGRVNE